MTTLGHAILGLLARESMSGYDLARSLKFPVGFFWHASHSQIYPELETLRRDGLVSQRLVEQKRRPDKKVFTITAAGRRALEAWITEPVERAPLRDELLLKTYSTWLATPERAAAFFRAEQARYAALVAQLEGVEQGFVATHRAQLQRPGTAKFAAYATLRAGLASNRARAEWCGWVATSLETGHTTGLPRVKSKPARRRPSPP